MLMSHQSDYSLIVISIFALMYTSDVCYTYTFENGLQDLYQDSTDDFDWSLGQSYTQSIKTGPSFDHTLFNEEGS